MLEYTTLALVLDKEVVNEADARVFFYTEDLGLVIGKAISAFKIKAKLNAHLEPFNLARVRLVCKNQILIIDALCEQRFKGGVAEFQKLATMAKFLKEALLPGQADQGLWAEVMKFFTTGGNEKELIASFGFEPSLAVCAYCGDQPKIFLARDYSFLCKRCFDLTPKEAWLNSYIQF